MLTNLKDVIDSRNRLLAIPVPPTTHSHKPVSLSTIFDLVDIFAEKYNLRIAQEYHRTAQKDKQFRLHFFFVSPISEDFQRELIILTSYNKSLSVRAAAGISVTLCSNGLTIGDYTIWNKQQGNVVFHFADFLEKMASSFDKDVRNAIVARNRMKEIKVSKEELYRIVGQLTVKREVTTEVVRIAIDELDNPSFPFEGDSDSLWFIYNCFTHAIKDVAPTHYLKIRQQLERYFWQMLN